MKNITETILNLLNNNHTKVEIKQDFSGNYYNCITDTIYISGKLQETKQTKRPKNINVNVARLIMLCHESIHSIQGKWLHLSNIIFSNLSIILTLVSIIMGLFWTNFLWTKLFGVVVIVASVVIRLKLELDAINGSVDLAEKLVLQEKIEGIRIDQINEGKYYIQKHKMLAILQMIADKIIFLVLILLIK